MKNAKRLFARKAAPKGQSSATRYRRMALAIWWLAWVLLSFIVASALTYVIVEAGYSLGVLPFEVIDSPAFDAVLVALTFSLAVSIAIGVPERLKKSRTSKEELGLQRLPSWQDIAFAPASFVIYFLLSGVLVALAMLLLPGFDAGQVQEVGFQGITERYEYVLAFLTLVVVAPVAEEVLFRGYMYGKLRSIIPMIPAMLLTAALFAALHLQLNVAVDVFALSLVMTSLREVSGSIWAGMLLHMLKNSVAFYFLFINPTFFNTMGM